MLSSDVTSAGAAGALRDRYDSDSMTPSTATKELCGAKIKRGGTCKKEAGWGTDHPGIGQCKLHGGSTPNAAKAAAKQIATTMGERLDIEPHEALIACVQITAGEVAYCTLMIQELRPEDYTGRPSSFTEESWNDGGKSISKEFPEALNIWIVARREAMDRLARFAKMALDAGVEERRVRLAEGMAQQLAPILQAIFKELGLSAVQKKKAPAILERHLVTLEASNAMELNGSADASDD